MDRDLSACSSWHRHRSRTFSLKHLSEGQGSKEQPEKLSVSARSWSQLPSPPELPRMGTQVLSYEQPSSLCRRFKSHNR